MKPHDLSKKLFKQPFKPFRMHFSDGKMLDIRHPSTVIVCEREAIVPTRFERDERFPIALDWETIQLDQIVRFSNLRNRRPRELRQRRPR